MILLRNVWHSRSHHGGMQMAMRIQRMAYEGSLLGDWYQVAKDLVVVVDGYTEKYAPTKHLIT